MNSNSIFNLPFSEKENQRICFGNLQGSSPALLTTQLAQKIDSPLLVITPDVFSAAQFEEAVHFFDPDLKVLNFPDWETLPYDQFSPHQDIISQRLQTLFDLSQLKRGILVVSVATLLQRLPPINYLSATTFFFTCGEKLNVEGLRERLIKSGYRCVAQVIEPGEFAVRGSILDLFPTGSDVPFRLDLFGDEIDSIRMFDPETQLSTDKVEKIRLLPAREFPLNDVGITHFRQAWREKFAGNPATSSMYQDVSQGMCPAGVEYYFPLFFDQTATLFDYLPKDKVLIRFENLDAAVKNFWEEILERYEQNRYDQSRPLLEPHELYLRQEELFGLCNQSQQIFLQKNPVEIVAGKYNVLTHDLPDIAVDAKESLPLIKLKNLIENISQTRILFCAETLGRREVLTDLLKTISIIPHFYKTWREFLEDDKPFGITISAIESGIFLEDPKILVIAESQLFGHQVMQRRRRKTKSFDQEFVVRNLAELSIGAPVVHVEQGVGRYLGLQTIQVGDVQREFMMLEYANQDKLYVPVSSLHLISRYSGGDLENAPLHRLGSEQWDKAKRKAAEQVKDVAAELLDIYARRAARKGHRFENPQQAYHLFASAFPFEETPDQAKAIEDVINDMISDKPMDRLVCGDVGFGKTEVAMRAAFIAAQEGKQVAVLVPTTLLAQQHYQNFKDRFADWPIQVEMISRFRSAQEQKNILEKLSEGKVDIVIGTHKLLQKDIAFKNLGLLIIDEEHRFGVHQKEKLKSLRAEVDILTLTATPIPRTLNMAMSQLRDLSIIATPPARRLSIKTFVREHQPGLVREAILRELLRGGQVYYLHNVVESIEKTAETIRTLVPQARVGVAHGQMREKELENVMADFYHHRFNVLVCTTIIETGIDIPSANTIIMDRADKFGLAQMHQLRGRVGRSHHQAYAYLITPPKKSLTSDAIKRLEAIESLEELGVGFALATHDLEIRGAGELLGESQSGNMHEIGFSLYMELLERAVKALQSGKDPLLDKPLQTDTEIDLQITALIPSDYVDDVHTRLVFYKRIANAENSEILKDIQVEMIDRFGLLPAALKNLFGLMALKMQVKSLGIRKIEAGARGGRMEFIENPSVDPIIVLNLIQKNPHLYKLEGPQKLRFTWENQHEKAEDRIQAVETLTSLLRGK